MSLLPNPLRSAFCHDLHPSRRSGPPARARLGRYRAPRTSQQLQHCTDRQQGGGQMIFGPLPTSLQQHINCSRGASQAFRTLIDELHHSFVGFCLNNALTLLLKISYYSSLLESLDRCEGTLHRGSRRPKLVQLRHRSMQGRRQVRHDLNFVQQLTSLVTVELLCRVKHCTKHENVRNDADSIRSCLQLFVGKSIFAITHMQHRRYGYSHCQAQHTSPELRPSWVQPSLLPCRQSASYRVLDLNRPLHRRHASTLVVSAEHSAMPMQPEEITHG